MTDFNEPGILTKEQIGSIKDIGKNPCIETKVNLDLDKKNRVINFLADERIKINCDYAIASKYGEIHIISHQVYEDRIKEVAAQFGLLITSFHTWDRRGK